jgi:ATP/maltotriose-dependent transcriptional regulator MalT
MSPELETVLSAFINVANDIPDHMVYVLDDYHQIEDPSIHQALTFLLGHLPPTLHFVLAGRLKLTAGDIAAAGECLERARPLVEGAPFPDWIGRFGRLQLECWLAQDSLRAAVEWADEMMRDNAPEGQPESVVAHLAMTQVLIVKGVLLPETPARVRSILRQNGYGAGLDARRIANEFIQWRGALTRDTDSMRNERDLVRAIVSPGPATNALRVRHRRPGGHGRPCEARRGPAAPD